MAPVLEAKSVGLDQKTVLKGELLIWRTKNQARDQGTVQLKGFNLLQMSLNWFLRNWTLDARLKWAIRVLKYFFVTGHPINKPCHKRKGLEL
jgi:hypothetical protein